jgi:hypothetical protein
LHINLFTAVLVTLIIRHGSSSHIERGSSARFWQREEASYWEKEESRTHIEIYIVVIITQGSLIMEYKQLELSRREGFRGETMCYKMNKKDG